MVVPWDIILVDAPLGLGAGPGREQSIFAAACLCQRRRSLIFVHDYGRPWDGACSDKYLGPSNEFLGTLALPRTTKAVAMT